MKKQEDMLMKGISSMLIAFMSILVAIDSSIIGLSDFLSVLFAFGFLVAFLIGVSQLGQWIRKNENIS